MGGSNILLQDKHFHPLVHNVLIIFADKGLCNFLVFCRQWFYAFLVPNLNVYQLSILQNELKYTFSVGIAYMHVDRLIFS